MAMIVGLVTGYLLGVCSVIIAVVIAEDLEDEQWKNDV